MTDHKRQKEADAEDVKQKKKNKIPTDPVGVFYLQSCYDDVKNS